MTITATPDVAILGAGTAGIEAWRAAVSLTDRVLVIEGGPLGTTCARTGCMPSKLLIAAADAARAVQEARRFGVDVASSAAVDGPRVMARVRQERDRFVDFATRTTAEIGEDHLLRGTAVFRDAHTAVVGDRQIQAKTWVIATGSRPARPALFDGLGDRLLVSDDVFDWQTLLPVLHEAADQGRIAGFNAARFPNVEPGLRRSPLSIIFTDPQIAVVGQGWSEVRDQRPVIGRVSFEDQGRSRIVLVNQGRLRVYGDRETARLLGAEMVCPRAEHLAHLLAWAHQLGLSVHQTLELSFYHPVIEAGLRIALRDAARQLSN